MGSIVLSVGVALRHLRLLFWSISLFTTHHIFCLNKWSFNKIRSQKFAAYAINLLPLASGHRAINKGFKAPPETHTASILTLSRAVCSSFPWESSSCTSAEYLSDTEKSVYLLTTIKVSGWYRGRIFGMSLKTRISRHAVANQAIIPYYVGNK